MRTAACVPAQLAGVPIGRRAARRSLCRPGGLVRGRPGSRGLHALQFRGGLAGGVVEAPRQLAQVLIVLRVRGQGSEAVVGGPEAPPVPAKMPVDL